MKPEDSDSALLLLNVQRRDLEGQPQERAVARPGQQQVEAARAAGQLLVLVQWDGDEANPTFSRGWALHPDFRAEAGEVLVRAGLPDAFADSDLDAQLRARGVRRLALLALPDHAAEVQATAASARALGYAVTTSAMEVSA